MLIGILSDSHGDADATQRGVDLLAARGAQAFFHCGDVCGESVLDTLVGRRAWFVWGNCDVPDAAARRYVEGVGLTWPELPFRVSLASRRIGMWHGHERGFRDDIVAGDLDYVFYGHTHKRDDHRHGTLRAINPGALFRTDLRTVALLDLVGDTLHFLTLDGRRVP